MTDIFLLWESQWPNRKCARLPIELSRLDPRLEHCVVFLGKILYSHSASLPPGV